MDRMLDMARGVGIAPHRPGSNAWREGFVVRIDRYMHMGFEKKPFNDYDGAVEWARKALDRKRAGSTTWPFRTCESGHCKSAA